MNKAKKYVRYYFNRSWPAALVYLILLVGFTISAFFHSRPLELVTFVLFGMCLFAFLGLVAASFYNLIRRRWRLGFIQALLVFGCAVITFFISGYVLFAAMLGPSEDGFADNLTIPEGIEISEPESKMASPKSIQANGRRDLFQEQVRQALVREGSDVTAFAPSIPSLRRAAIDHADAFREYIEASPDWHVFIEQGNHFASRRWSYEGEPRNTLHGYISEFFGSDGFQTRCLLCLDRKQWSRYSVQRIEEGKKPIEPEMSMGNQLHESRVMIDCGEVWVEVFEQSTQPERRVTKATLAALEKEFSDFMKDPDEILNQARFRSRELAKAIADTDGPSVRLMNGMQPGKYVAVYSLNTGEKGSVYLKAFEITQGTPLSTQRLESASKTRMAWSEDASELFGAKAGFTIYEGDWGKPYAARFEVWFKPDSGTPERKLTERNFKIEGWQR